MHLSQGENSWISGWVRGARQYFRGGEEGICLAAVPRSAGTRCIVGVRRAIDPNCKPMMETTLLPLVLAWLETWVLKGQGVPGSLVLGTVEPLEGYAQAPHVWRCLNLRKTLLTVC